MSLNYSSPDEMIFDYKDESFNGDLPKSFDPSEKWYTVKNDKI